MISTRKARKIRAGFQYAHSYEPHDHVRLPGSAFSVAYKRERVKMKLMDSFLVGQDRETYQTLLLAGSLGFMNKNTRNTVLAIEGSVRRQATMFIKGVKR